MPMSIPPKVDVFPLKGSVIVPKGALLFMKAGFLILAVTGDAVNRQIYCAIKAVDSTGIADGGLGVSVVGRGQRVTALIGADTLHPGDNVKLSGTANAFDLHVQGVDDDNLIKGTFIGIESEVYSKSGISPFAESFTIRSNPEVNGLTTTIGVFQLGV